MTPRSRRWLVPLGVMGACTSLWAAPRSRARAAGDEQISIAVEGLARAYSGERPGEGRLSVDLGYAAYRPGKTAAYRQAPVEDPRFMPRVRAAAAVQKAVEGRTDASSLRALAILDLLWGRNDAAVAGLTEAARSDKGAESLNDLAVARLARASEQDQPQDLLLALAAAEGALARNASLAAAHFNRALALERLFLVEAAREAWERFLELDGESPWREEAEARRRAVSSLSQADAWRNARASMQAPTIPAAQLDEIVRRFPQQVREYGEDELLSEWAEAELEGSGRTAQEAIARARAIGEALARAGGDALLRDSAQAISAAARDPDRHKAIASAHWECATALQEQRAGQFAAAGERWKRCAVALYRHASPFAAKARLQGAVCDYQLSQLEQALVEVRELSQLNADVQPSIVGRARWLEGLTLSLRGQWAEAQRAYERAIEALEAAREEANLGAVHNLLGAHFLVLGDSARAWRHFHSALRLAVTSGNARRTQATFSEASAAALAAGVPKGAGYFQKEATRAAERLGDPISRSQAWLGEAELCVRVGSGDCRDELRQLEAAARSLPDGAFSQTQLGRARLLEAQVLASSRPRRAQDLLESEEVQSLRGAEDRFSALEADLVAAQVALAAGDMLRAERLLAGAIDEIEHQRMEVEGISRISFADRRAGAYRSMVGLQFSELSRPDLAFEFAERERSRDLLDRLADASGESVGVLDWRSVARALPARLALVEYACAEDTLLVWAITSGRLTARQVRVSCDALEASLAALSVAAQAADRAGFEAIASDLHGIFIDPIAESIAEAEHLIISPPGRLAGVPFAALRDRRDGRYLVQRAAVSVVPSASLAAHLQRRAPRAALGTSPLLVDNPDFDRVLFPGLPDLPGTAAEREALRGVFPATDVLSGASATVPAVLSRLSGASLFHFAGHALTGPGEAESGGLVLAPSAQDAGVLYPEDLVELRLPRTELVVLAACATAAGTRSPTEGPISAVRPFLAAGVPAVVATLWPVDDVPTSRLFRAFYAALAKGADAAPALRQAQLELANDSEPAVAWGGFVLFGGRQP